MIEFALRFVGAGILVAAIPWVAAHFGNNVAGVVLLFPAVTLAGFVALAVERGTPAIAEASAAAVGALPVVLIFLLTVHVAARYELPVAVVLGVGLVAWLAAAALLAVLTSRVRERE